MGGQILVILYFLGDDLLYQFLFHRLRLKTLQREVSKLSYIYQQTA